MNITLTNEQKAALDSCLSYLGKGQNCLLKGSAGTGKTTLVKFIVDAFLEAGKMVAISAPTHKAVSVLRSKVEDDPDYIKFGTVHSVMRLKMERDLETGEQYFIQRNPDENPLKHFSLLIVDEASMLNSEVYTILACNSTPILFVGDHKQLNPVNETHSVVFEKVNNIVSLETVMRQASGNAILDVAYDTSLLDKRVDLVTNDIGVYHTNSEPEIVTTIAQNSNDYIYLAWTNKMVDRMNTAVRTYKYGENVLDYVPGETIMFTQRFMQYSNLQRYTIQRSVTPQARAIFLRGQRHEIPCYMIDDHILVPTKYGIKVLDRVLAIAHQLCMQRKYSWDDYDILQESYARLSYTYALTVHKSQGSEWPYVILNLANLERNTNKEECKRMVYTAITRARKRLIIYGRT